MIHVNRGTTSLGVFSEQEVREGLSAGRFSPTDIGWREGMATWQPLSQFSEFGGAAAPAAAPPVQPSAAPAVTDVAARNGLPWEHRQERGFFNAFIETLTMVLTRPAEAFSVMKREGGLGEPIIYALIGGCAGGIVSFLFSLGLQSIGLFADKNNGLAAMAGMGIGSVAVIILLPLFIVIGLFIFSGIVHLCLMIVGGANQPFETTFRVLAFSQGSAGPLQIIPLCGGLISGVWALVCNCIGLARAHETDTGRAVLAIFLPVIVCCGGGLVIAFMFGAMGAWTASHH
ncbi:MAG TPA: YIP1 family protein [Chthoniobacterales bacterium]|nr:YIP1 family protein [Chthoniobacterales bacterium]